MRPSTFNNLKDLRVKIVQGGNDEGTEGKLKTKQKLTPCNTPPPWDVCDISQALLAAPKDKETVNL